MDTIYFRPVRGTEANILNTEYDNGCVYFATDTKKIYVDGPKPEDNKIPMGGTSGIYYGNLIHDQTPDPGQTEFEFTVKNMSKSGALFDLAKLDNISKNICDALKGIAYPDDKAIVDGAVHKLYAETDYVMITIRGFKYE